MGELVYKIVLYLLVGALALALYWSCKKKQEPKRLQKQAVELLQDMGAKKLRQLLGNVRTSHDFACACCTPDGCLMPLHAVLLPITSVTTSKCVMRFGQRQRSIGHGMAQDVGTLPASGHR